MAQKIAMANAFVILDMLEMDVSVDLILTQMVFQMKVSTVLNLFVNKTTVPIFQTLAKKMLTMTELVTAVTMILTMMEYQTLQTTVYLLPILVKRMGMETI